jgi:hypothetical protein
MTVRALKFRGDDAPSLSDVLAKLKRTGCTILVAGESRMAREAMSQRLFGAPDVPRHRVLLAPNGDYPVEPWLPRGVSPSHVKTVSVCERDRSATAAHPDAPSPQSIDLDTALDELHAAIADWSHRFDPGVLRVGVHTADTLAEAYGREQALSFLEDVFERVRNRRGMGHVYLDQPTEHPLVDDVEPLVDAVVEVRFPDTHQPEQRWYIPQYGYTNWVQISPSH